MKLGDTWYCNTCGSKIADGNRLCPACLTDAVEATRKAIVADGKRAVRDMAPERAINVLTALYTNASSQYVQHALALAVHALSHLDSAKKNQPSQFGDSSGLVSRNGVD
jgi:hypothetical protein